MGNVNGFLQIKRTKPHARPVHLRVHDWNEVYLPTPEKEVRDQGSRCMDCGIPFCHQGCPLGNHIPDWNDLVYRHRWQAASERLHATNNFPDFTGRLCPAPCEGSCVLGINDDPVTIKNIELSIVERAFEEGWIRASRPAARTGKRVAVVGSGPAGLAAADQLNKAGHLVTVFEKSDRIGGLLRYGIPEFKIEKRLIDRRLALLEEEGVLFRTGVNVGVDLPVETLRAEFDAIVLCGGAGWPRDLQVPGRELGGIHFAVDYLTQQNRLCEGDTLPDDPLIGRRRQARHHHRRRRHWRRLPGHRAPAGRAVGAPVRAAAASAGVAARRTIPGRSGRASSGARRRTTRVASGCSRSPPSDSSATTTGACARWRRSTSKSRGPASPSCRALR